MELILYYHNVFALTKKKLHAFCKHKNNRNFVILFMDKAQRRYKVLIIRWNLTYSLIVPPHLISHVFSAENL